MSTKPDGTKTNSTTTSTTNSPTNSPATSTTTSTTNSTGTSTGEIKTSPPTCQTIDIRVPMQDYTEITDTEDVDVDRQMYYDTKEGKTFLKWDGKYYEIGTVGSITTEGNVLEKIQVLEQKDGLIGNEFDCILTSLSFANNGHITNETLDIQKELEKNCGGDEVALYYKLLRDDCLKTFKQKTAATDELHGPKMVKEKSKIALTRHIKELDANLRKYGAGCKSLIFNIATPYKRGDEFVYTGLAVSNFHKWKPVFVDLLRRNILKKNTISTIACKYTKDVTTAERERIEFFKTSDRTKWLAPKILGHAVNFTYTEKDGEYIMRIIDPQMYGREGAVSAIGRGSSDMEALDAMLYNLLQRNPVNGQRPYPWFAHSHQLTFLVQGVTITSKIKKKRTSKGTSSKGKTKGGRKTKRKKQKKDKTKETKDKT